MTKLIAVVGQKIDARHTRAVVNDWLTKNPDSSPWRFEFPEAYYGPNAAREIINSSLKDSPDAYVVTTRYSTILEHLTNISIPGPENLIPRENLFIYLFNDVKDDMKFRIYQLNKEFFLNDWPIGVLW